MALRVTTWALFVILGPWGCDFRSSLGHNDTPSRKIHSLSFREAETWQSETLEMWTVNW